MTSIRRFDWIFHLAAITLCGYFCASALTTYLEGLLVSSSDLPPTAVVSTPTPAEPLPAPSADADDEEGGEDWEAYRSIVERNIFNSADTGETAVGANQNPDVPLGEMGPAVKTSLGIKVMSTLVIGEGNDRRSSAIISGGTSKTPKAYYPGEEETFGSNVRLTKIARDRIEFLNNNRLEFAELEDWATKKTVFASAEEVHGKGAALGDKSSEAKDAAAPAAEGGKITLDQKEIDEALQNLDKLQQDVRIVPNFKDGKISGLKVISIKPGTVISKLGIRRGDILEKLNGQELDVKRGLEMFGTMKDSKNFSLDIARGGKSQTFEYEIK